VENAGNMIAEGIELIEELLPHGEHDVNARIGVVVELAEVRDKVLLPRCRQVDKELFELVEEQDQRHLQFRRGLLDHRQKSGRGSAGSHETGLAQGSQGGAGGVALHPNEQAGVFELIQPGPDTGIDQRRLAAACLGIKDHQAGCQDVRQKNVNFPVASGKDRGVVGRVEIEKFVGPLKHWNRPVAPRG